jgi:hypothetical protein
MRRNNLGASVYTVAATFTGAQKMKALFWLSTGKMQFKDFGNVRGKSCVAC